MNPKMQEALYSVSTCFDADPNVVFQKIVEEVAAYYDNTTAMINLDQEDCLLFRAVANPRPRMIGLTSFPMQRSFCQFALRTDSPILVQNAEEHPVYCTHPAVEARIRRYLGVPIRNPQGKAIGTLCFLDDKVEQPLGEEDIQFLTLLTMRVNAEVERERMVQERIEEHRKAAERLAELNARLEAAAEGKRQFVAMVVHDLRHPLTALKTLLYLLESETDPAERAATLSAMQGRLQALTTLLNGLLQVNEVESGRVPPRLERVHLPTLLSECVASFAPAFVSESVRLECQISPKLAEAQTDADKIVHILLNLLSNALKFTAEGTVWVRALPHGSAHWRLEVEDTGIGIHPDVKERIFEEFYRAGAARQGSVGLGLAIVHQLCQALQAEVSVESVPGTGTCFRLTFPRALPTTPPETQSLSQHPA